MIDYDPYDIETPRVKTHGLFPPCVIGQSFMVEYSGSSITTVIQLNNADRVNLMNYDKYGKHGEIAIAKNAGRYYDPAVVSFENGYTIYRKLSVRIRPSGSLLDQFLEWMSGSSPLNKPPLCVYSQIELTEEQARDFAVVLHKLSKDQRSAMMMSLDLGLFPSGEWNNYDNDDEPIPRSITFG